MDRIGACMRPTLSFECRVFLLRQAAPSYTTCSFLSFQWIYECVPRNCSAGAQRDNLLHMMQNLYVDFWKQECHFSHKLMGLCFNSLSSQLLKTHYTSLCEIGVIN
jgi:hypothetical protein